VRYKWATFVRMPAAKRKNREIRFRATPLDLERLKALAKFSELSRGAVMRRLLAQAIEREGLKVNA
jgi:hypothetical protein